MNPSTKFSSSLCRLLDRSLLLISYFLAPIPELFLPSTIYHLLPTTTAASPHQMIDIVSSTQRGSNNPMNANPTPLANTPNASQSFLNPHNLTSINIKIQMNIKSPNQPTS